MRALILMILLATFALRASAVNLSGKWAMELSDRPGRTMHTTLILSHVGDKVTGSVVSAINVSNGSPTGTEIYGGKVEGDTISFYVWVGQDRPVKRVFRGTISGDEIHFTVAGSPVRFNVRGERLDPPGPQEVTAKRTK